MRIGDADEEKALGRIRQWAEPHPGIEPIYAWCHIVVMKPKQESAGEFITEFKRTHQPLEFTPLAYYGFYHPETCEFLMFYSVRARTVFDAGEFMRLRFCYPDGHFIRANEPNPPCLSTPFADSVEKFVEGCIHEIDNSQRFPDTRQKFGEAPDFSGLVERTRNMGLDARDLNTRLKEFEEKVTKAREPELVEARAEHVPVSESVTQLIT